MSVWSPDFEKKLIESNRLKEPRPVCPPPCHGAILASDGGTGGLETMLKCVKCVASTSYPNAVPA